MFRDIFQGFVKLHILYHAAQGKVFGLELMEELERHGYRLSPGTIYPVLHSLEKDGFLVSEKQIVSGKVRRYYSITVEGNRVLAEGTQKAGELFKEINLKE